MKYESHDFYCLKCGNKGLNIYRPTNRRKEKFHRKKLYCFYCKEEINHLECKNYDDVIKFKEDWCNGLIQKENGEIR